jgi:EAL domain-containing protein (putative c-di-GMP-specific phosphodiesterase class I)
VRWRKPDGRLVLPINFVQVAEETGLIVPLGRWVLEESCRQIAEWRSTPAGRNLVISVNLSARQFVHADLVEDVAAVLSASGLEPAALELEITESVVMDQSDVGIRGLRRLRDLGVRLVLDDFGTGYSSLAYLKHLPLDTIKIDRSFVAGLDGPADRAIVQAVLALADGLGIGVVAEGIETETQRAQLLALGCELGQGYLFSPPVPADAATRLIAPLRTPRPAVRTTKPKLSSGRRRKDAAGTGRG